MSILRAEELLHKQLFRSSENPHIFVVPFCDALTVTAKTAKENVLRLTMEVVSEHRGRTLLISSYWADMFISRFETHICGPEI